MKALKVYSKHKARLNWFFVLVALCIGILGAGLAWQQLVFGYQYEKQRQHQQLRYIAIPGGRGEIFDRKHRLLAGNRWQFSLVLYLGDLKQEVYRKQVAELRKQRKEDPDFSDFKELKAQAQLQVVQSYLDQVNQLLRTEYQIDSKKLEKAWESSLLSPFVLVESLTEQAYACLMGKLPTDSPLQLYLSLQRYYPYGECASHVLGYVVRSELEVNHQLSNQELVTLPFKTLMGRQGVEQQFNLSLAGEAGGEVWSIDAAGRARYCLLRKPAQAGKDLNLSLDIELQKVAEESFRDKKGAAVVIEIPTDEVLVLASRPGFDLERLVPSVSKEVFESITERGAWLNRATQGLYPPGSSFKIISSMALFQQGLIDEKESEAVFECLGGEKVGNRFFRCPNHPGQTLLTFKQVIAKSCNTFFYRKGLQGKISVLTEMVLRFGLDVPTGIEIPFETRHMIVPSESWKREWCSEDWREGDTVNFFIGQGFLRVTPLQMACFIAAFAKKTVRIRPLLQHSLKERITHEAANKENFPLNDSQYNYLIEGMESAVFSGSARRAQLGHYRIAGKTGTGQIPTANEMLHVGWFIGFAPVEDPKIAVAIAVEEDKSIDSLYAGSATAAPIAHRIFQKYFQSQEEQAQIRTSALQ